MVTTNAQQTDRQTRLIQAATELFTERAYDEVTTTEVAKRAGVAYGLIAHYFDNKRGLYLAVIQAAADHLRSIRDMPAQGNTPRAQLRDGISRYIRYIDDNAAGYLRLMRGGNGSDPAVREIVDTLRWEAAQRILHGLGVTGPVAPLLRATMRGWVGYLDELILDHLLHDDIAHEHLVDLATANLVTALRAAMTLDPHIGLAHATLDALTATE